MKYLFNNAEFDLNSKTPLIVAGKERKVDGLKPRKIIEFLLKNNNSLQSRADITAYVWGKDGAATATDEALNTAITRANKALAGICRIEGERHQGYRLDVEVTRVKPIVLKDVIIHEKLPINKQTLLMCIACLIFFLFGAFTLVKAEKLTEEPRYGVKNAKGVFMRNQAISAPQLSTDGRYIAHRVAHQDKQDHSLAITQIGTSNTIELAKMRYGDGFSLNQAGNKIVYQTRVDNDCQIRLIHLDANKSVKNDELLAKCIVNGSTMTFVWFNEHQFYFNQADKEDQKAGLPLNQLYSFNIKTKKKTKELSTEREGGIGFYSLTYDNANNAAYMLKVNKQHTTDVYRYKNGELTKVITFSHILHFYTVFNGQLIYVNNLNELVLNNLTNSETSIQVLMPSVEVITSMPYVVGNKIIFLSGHRLNYALHKLDENWPDRPFDKVPLTGFIPDEVASHNNSLVFSSKQTGINQIYKQMPDGKVQQLSDFEQDANIDSISVISDLFAISYISRVEFYYLKQGKLEYANVLKGYSFAMLADNGKTMLATKVGSNQQYAAGSIVELQLQDFNPTGIVLKQTAAASYYDDDIIYVNNQNQLMQFNSGQPKLLHSNVFVTANNQLAHSKNKLYYINQDTKKLMTYDFSNGATKSIQSRKLHPLRIVAIEENIYVHTQTHIPPKLMLGKLVKTN